MSTIVVSHLKKYYKIYKRAPGITSTLKSLFSRPYEIIRAVDDISFEIKKGELVGFIGPNGAGKTTTLKCLSGLLYPSSGNIKVLGFRPFDRKSEYLKKISLIMGQKNQLWWDLPAMDTFVLNKEIYEIDDRNFKSNLAEITRLLDVEDLIYQPVRQLSLGQRMRLELVASLIHKPQVLFLDEPTIGLDVVMQKKMRDFIAEYNRKYKATIILTSHYMSDVKKLCRRIIIINKGKLIYDGNLDNLVEKYADTKIITAEINGSFDKKEIALLGKVKINQEGKIIIVTPKKKTNYIVGRLFKKYDLIDLNIEDPEIDDVIRYIFEKK